MSLITSCCRHSVIFILCPSRPTILSFSSWHGVHICAKVLKCVFRGMRGRCTYTRCLSREVHFCCMFSHFWTKRGEKRQKHVVLFYITALSITGPLCPWSTLLVVTAYDTYGTIMTKGKQEDGNSVSWGWPCRKEWCSMACYVVGVPQPAYISYEVYLDWCVAGETCYRLLSSDSLFLVIAFT